MLMIRDIIELKIHISIKMKSILKLELILFIHLQEQNTKILDFIMR